MCQLRVNRDLHLKHDTTFLLFKADRLGGQHVYKTSHSPTLSLFRLSLDDCLLRLIDTFYRIINQINRWNITNTVCIEFNSVGHNSYDLAVMSEVGCSFKDKVFI